MKNINNTEWTIMINKRGFTLVELLTVIALIGILAAIAIPSYFSWLPSYQLRSASRDLYSGMQNAKMIAVRNNTCATVRYTVALVPANGGGSYLAFIDDGTGGGVACNGIQDGGEANIGVAVVVSAPIALSAVSNIGAVNGVCFNSRGLVCSSQSGNVQLINNNGRWSRVQVRAAGSVRIQQSTDNGANWSN